MNKKKSQKSMSLGTLLILITGAVFVAGGGIFYVVMKNSQVQTQREIARVEKQIEEHEVAITSDVADIEKQLGVFRLREQLQREDSGLVSIPPGFVEICERKNQRETTVVSRE